MKIGGLSLAQLTVLDVEPIELISIAGELACDHVTLFTFVPARARGIYPQVTSEDLPALRSAMRAANVTAANLEIFPLDGAEDWDGFARALEVGASLGATRATFQLHNLDRTEMPERIARFCDLAAVHGIVAGLEFNRFSAVADISSAVGIVREANRSNAAIVLDMLHLARVGDGADKVPQAAGMIKYVQLCDGPLEIADNLRWHEAVHEREIPGLGEFPIVEALKALDPSEIIFDAEVPLGRRREAGVSPLERARLAITGARTVLRAAYGDDAA